MLRLAIQMITRGMGEGPAGNSMDPSLKVIRNIINVFFTLINISFYLFSFLSLFAVFKLRLSLLKNFLNNDKCKKNIYISSRFWKFETGGKDRKRGIIFFKRLKFSLVVDCIYFISLKSLLCDCFATKRLFSLPSFSLIFFIVKVPFWRVYSRLLISPPGEADRFPCPMERFLSRLKF